ncbi:hypothetical protein JB92DRAFT_2749807 [Gautieria morchelliformis]|nr:hypothetical protein JB92DRAFT_2749807 [Gautieria morchelliformis]
MACQLVSDQLESDPNHHKGPWLIKEAIRFDTGVNLTRFYRNEMHTHNPDGFAFHEPTAKRIHRTALVSIRLHELWSKDGHDKLCKIGFPVYGIYDVWLRKWLGLWVVPNNQLKSIIEYLYLSLIEEQGGMPIQTTSDCGSETTEVYGLANELWEAFSPNLPIGKVPAHCFLQSMHNITIECGWLSLQLHLWHPSVCVPFLSLPVPATSDIIPFLSLVQWLWPRLIQQELDEVKERFNNHPMHHDKNKTLPSGVSPNVAYTTYLEYGAVNCIQQVDMDVVHALKEETGGEELVCFISCQYKTHSKAVYEMLGVHKLTLQNVWDVFSHMLPLV